MSLYDDDIDTDKTAASGWASGIKLMHNQLAFKKATITAVSYFGLYIIYINYIPFVRNIFCLCVCMFNDSNNCLLVV